MTVINIDFAGYRLIFLLFCFGVTGGITVVAIIIIRARFGFIKRLIPLYEDIKPNISRVRCNLCFGILKQSKTIFFLVTLQIWII